MVGIEIEQELVDVVQQIAIRYGRAAEGSILVIAAGPDAGLRGAVAVAAEGLDRAALEEAAGSVGFALSEFPASQPAFRVGPQVG